MAENESKFARIDPHLRIAVGVEIPHKSISRVDRVVIMPKTQGVAELHPYPKRNSTKVYFDLTEAGLYPEKIQIVVSDVLDKAPWGEILFSNNRTGAQVLFGREDEERPFGPEKGKYVILRLYRDQESPFKPVYARVDKGEKTWFFAIRAQWQNKAITVDIERSPQHIPYFLR